MCSKLEQLLTLAEVTKALGEMVNGKLPSLDGMITELFKALWPTIGEEYLRMLQDSIARGSLLLGVTEGLIV
jgi:hypothetical protein